MYIGRIIRWMPLWMICLIRRVDFALLMSKNGVDNFMIAIQNQRYLQKIYRTAIARRIKDTRKVWIREKLVSGSIFRYSKEMS